MQHNQGGFTAPKGCLSFIFIEGMGVFMLIALAVSHLFFLKLITLMYLLCYLVVHQGCQFLSVLFRAGSCCSVKGTVHSIV